jgi:hypothetical protein
VAVVLEVEGRVLVWDPGEGERSWRCWEESWVVYEKETWE